MKIPFLGVCSTIMKVFVAMSPLVRAIVVIALNVVNLANAECSNKDWFRTTRSDDVQAVTQCVAARGKDIVNLRDEAGW